MTNQEFLNGFDIYFNNIASNQAPGLNVHEISVLLTKAQDELVKNYFNPKGNKFGEGFDGNQKRQVDFSYITNVWTQTGNEAFGSPLFDGRAESKSIALPSDMWMIVNEKLYVVRGKSTVELVVKPITFEEYDRLMSKPYKRPVKQQAWRLITNVDSRKADLIVGPKDACSKYIVRYVRQPKPIIVGDLDGLTINGFTYGGDTTPATPASKTVYGDSCCELDPILHEEILQRAIELAKIAWTQTGQDNAQAVLQAGQRSE